MKNIDILKNGAKQSHGTLVLEGKQMKGSSLKSNGVTLEVGFENANPPKGEYVTLSKAGGFQIRQRLEENALPGYGFHLHVALRNERSGPRLVPVRILWADTEYDDLRDCMYIGYNGGASWKMLAMRSVHGVTDLELVLPAGRHLLCVTPKFDVGDYLRLLAQYPKTGLVERINVGQSLGGHPIDALRAGNPRGKPIVVTTRAHGYETAGAYCLEGWLQALAANPARYARILDRLNIHLLPMINPDAVSAGNCCLAPSGVDFFNRGLVAGAKTDRGAKALLEFIRHIRPAVYLDMHNYTRPRLEDALWCPDRRLRERFAKDAPDRSKDQKIWVISNRGFEKKATKEKGHLLGDCAKNFGTIPVITEFPWYARTPPEMREHGKAFFDAFFRILAENQQLSENGH